MFVTASKVLKLDIDAVNVIWYGGVLPKTCFPPLPNHDTSRLKFHNTTCVLPGQCIFQKLSRVGLFTHRV